METSVKNTRPTVSRVGSDKWPAKSKETSRETSIKTPGRQTKQQRRNPSPETGKSFGL